MHMNPYTTDGVYQSPRGRQQLECTLKYIAQAILYQSLRGGQQLDGPNKETLLEACINPLEVDSNVVVALFLCIPLGAYQSLRGGQQLVKANALVPA